MNDQDENCTLRTTEIEMKSAASMNIILKHRTIRIPTLAVILVAAAAAAATGCTPDAGSEHHHGEMARGPVAPPRVASVRQAQHVAPPPPLASATPPAPAPPVADPSYEARLLVIAADGSEPVLPLIRQTLDYVGTPYDIEIASAPGELTVNQLQQSGQGRYQGIVLTSGNLAYFNGTSYQSALSDTEWQTIWSYEATYRVRQVTWYTYPTADYGFGAPQGSDTTAAPITGSLTATRLRPSASTPTGERTSR
jgi:hypothetical protein